MSHAQEPLSIELADQPRHADDVDSPVIYLAPQTTANDPRKFSVVSDATAVPPSAGTSTRRLRRDNSSQQNSVPGFAARRSVLMQFEALMALAESSNENAVDSAGRLLAAADCEEAHRSPNKDLLRKGPLHADINRLFPDVKHPPLSKEELNAFYLYSLATEPMTIVVFTALSSVVLQNLAAGAGKEASDHSLQCNYTVSGYSCVTNIAGAWIDPSSFSLYTTAASVLLQAFFFISLGALADHSSFRKKFMIAFMVCAVVACMSMVAVRDSWLFLLASIAVILAQLFFGASYCFYNSYIPVLSSVHWDVLSAPEGERMQMYEKTMNTLSGISQVYGYCGAVGCFAVAGGTIFGLQTLSVSSGFGDSGFFDSTGVSTYAMQFGIFITALWTLIGLYWPARFIRDRPYVSLPKGTNYITYSWKQVWGSVKKAKKMPNTFLMLLAWFVLSDGLTTVGSTTILFATNELGFSTTEILVLAIAAPLTAGGGNYLWLLVQRKWNVSTKRMLMSLLGLSILLPIYGLLGFVAPFGLKWKWELFPAGVYYGMLLGGIQSFSRVMFGELIPRGKEGEFFSLYAITDKGSSWFGPLIVGAITDATHEIRYGFGFLLVMLCIPVGVLYCVDMEKGVRDAELFHAEDLDEQMRLEAKNVELRRASLPCDALAETLVQQE
ncbi:Autophagy protein 22 [Entophlyctis luteolus]|nr:Autophagy protein 22 [Entophlyctis luteolus]KAJ3382169.1 Autophagy protein 22 [Entophlyctis sp. JEL0112]